MSSVSFHRKIKPLLNTADVKDKNNMHQCSIFTWSYSWRGQNLSDNGDAVLPSCVNGCRDKDGKTFPNGCPLPIDVLPSRCGFPVKNARTE